MAEDPNTDIPKNVTAKEICIRGLFMLLFVVIYSVTEFVVVVVAVFQFFAVLFTGNSNPYLLEFGQNLSRFVYQMMRFFTFNTDDKPFPFAPWPSPEHSETPTELHVS
jgi:hypothetical protein